MHAEKVSITKTVGRKKSSSRTPPHTTLFKRAKLDNSIVNRYLSAADDDFVYCVDLDIRRFVERANPKAVLIFPPFSSYRRFLIHRVCASRSFSQHDIVTFSIGIGDERRTVVCFRHQLLQDVKATSGKRFEESTSGVHGSSSAPKPHYVSWRSSTTPPTASTSTITTINSCGASGNVHATASTNTICSSNTAPVCGRKRSEGRDVTYDQQDNMGTETILQNGGAIGVHQQHLQHGATSSNTQQRSYLFDEDAVYDNALKDSPLHQDTIGHSHQQDQSAIGGKLPPVVGIYRPPAARRALNLAENIVHQLAPPAACEHPNDYGHLTPSNQHHPSAPGHQQVQLLLHTAAEGGTEPDKIIIAPNSREGHPLSKDKAGSCEKTGLTRQETVQSSSQANVPDCTRQIGSNESTGNSNGSNSIGVTSPRNNRPPRERRPDRAVYVPRARRSLTTPPVATAQSPPEAAEVTVANTSPTKGLSRTASNRVQHPETRTSLEPVTVAISQTSTVSSKEVVKLKDGKRKLSEFTSSVQLQSGNTGAPNCDPVIEAPLHAHATGSCEVSLEALKKRSFSLDEQREPLQVEVKEDREALTVSSFYLNKRTEESLELSTGQQEEITKENSDCSNPETIVTMQRNNQRNRNVRNTAGITPSPLTTGMLITDSNESEKIDRDEKELRRASQEINRSNRRIMKQTFNSDVLEIGDPTPPPSQKPVKAKRTPASIVTESVEERKTIVAPVNGAIPNGNTTNSEAVKTTTTTATDGEEDADDWESMYDDNGDCLNPKMLEELTTAVGKVSIQTPQSDYKLFETKQAVLNEEEFPHVLEVSNFPAEFKTQDLMMLFSQYKETGFDIKWVDDTHALAVFSSSKIAAEVLTTGLSFARVKPLAEATAESRSKARKCASSLQPYRARPETCAAMARRMVSSALGVKLKTAPEERENERRLLREAKERKRLAAKQRDEVWDS